ncbi:methionine aminotransferase [Olivibacter sitiensis]|uniref:methionine aminotransferase n=1 Tax=Olivibacter sitiensis TaxID=376470 RepID=UPI000480738B|nr:methionine aminotransferase [Olivibacter sitiensis]
MINISSKLPAVNNSIFSIMSALATEQRAINLSQGFPDFNCNPKLISLVNKYMKAGNNQYAPMPGVLSFREKIAEKIQELYQAEYHADEEITVTAGATQAIFTAIAAIIRPDDEVIAFDPSYDCYAPAVDLFGGIIKTVELKPENNFAVEWDKVKKLFSSKTRMIIINTPQNPCGKCFTDNDMQQLIKITQGTDIIILSDEVYEHILFDRKHISVCQYPELRERSFVVSSFGKTYHVTGWKIGYCAAPQRLTQEFRKIHQYQVFSVNTPLQMAINEFMKNKDELLALNDFFKEKMEFLYEGLKQTKFKPIRPQGTYFLLADYSAISDLDDISFTKEVTVQHKVASIPLSVFYKSKLDDHIIRFCFAKKKETLEKALEKLIKIDQLSSTL